MSQSQTDIARLAGQNTHPCHHALSTPDKPAFIFEPSGEITTYKQLDEKSNQAAHLFRKHALKKGDGIAVFMTNQPEFLEICWAAQRAGLYFTAIPSKLTASEVAYIIEDSGAKMIILSQDLAPIAQQLSLLIDKSITRIVVKTGGEDGAKDGSGLLKDFADYHIMCQTQPTTPIADQSCGADMLYSSGNDGQAQRGETQND